MSIRQINISIIINTVFFLFICLGHLNAQERLTIGNDQFERTVNSESDIIWLKSLDKKLSVQDFLDNGRNAFGLSTNDNFLLKSEETDQLGFRHVRLLQMHNDIVIEGADLVVHEQDGKVSTANGLIIKSLNLNSNPSFSELEAFDKLENHIGIANLPWANTDIDKELFEIGRPKGELIFTKKDRSIKLAGDNLTLAYKFTLTVQEPQHDIRTYYIDAVSGDIIYSVTQLHNCSPASGTTLFDGTQNFTTQQANGTYKLEDFCKGNGIVTREFAGQDIFGNISADDITDNDNNWTDNEDRVGVSAHWATLQTYEYFQSEHNRNGLNGNGVRVDVYVDYNVQTDNAFYFDNEIYVTPPGGFFAQPLATVDVLAHEFTHGVTVYTSNLVYEKEPGALNESFSDIFGVLVEFYTVGNQANWDLGEDAANQGDPPLRRMADPKGGLIPQPDSYGGEFWRNPNCNPDQNNDLCGVHINSGVQNYWFYLLAEGGSGTNDSGNSYNVQGIGIDKAAQIAYRNLVSYLNNNSNFQDAKNGSIQAATDLYGSCSDEVQAVISAWNAVNVSADTCAPPCTVGAACDDNDACTTGETFDANCNCNGGVFQDSDNDGVCNVDDNCPGGNDNFDDDLDGIPNDCDSVCDCTDAIVTMETFTVGTGNNDAEEDNTGSMNLTSGDLDMVMDSDNASTTYKIGLRYENIDIPANTAVSSANLKFAVDEQSSGSASFVIQIENSTNSAAFSTSNSNLSNRNYLNSSVSWSNVPSWDNVGDSGGNQTSPDISSLINAAIEQNGLAANNAMTLMITGFL